ncbi:MAG: membrane dipeptidase [Tepidisphaeraceae bacterium]
MKSPPSACPICAGGVRGVNAVIFCEPSFNSGPGYTSADEAYAMARVQLAIYEQWHAAGEFAIRGHGGDANAMQAIILMEGADAIRNVDDLDFFASSGVKIIGLAWQATRYAGGTGQPGPLTPEGRAIVREIDKLKLIHDASHLAEQSYWDLFELAERPVIATHSNCRAIVRDDPRERHLSDDMIRRLLQRDGMIGINFFDKFLLPAEQFGQRRATLDDVIAHVKHVCDLAGNATQIGIGTDMDGGLGQQNIPVEIKTSGDLPKLGHALLAAGFNDADARGILGENWRRFFDRVLPTA